MSSRFTERSCLLKQDSQRKHPIKSSGPRVCTQAHTHTNKCTQNMIYLLSLRLNFVTVLKKPPDLYLWSPVCLKRSRLESHKIPDTVFIDSPANCRTWASFYFSLSESTDVGGQLDQTGVVYKRQSTACFSVLRSICCLLICTLNP